MDPSILDDSGHNDILGSEDGLNVEATIDEHLEETGFDLDSNHWPVPRQSGPEVDTVAPSPVVGQSSTFNFENLLAHAIRNVAESPVQLPWESDEWACIFDPTHDPLETLVPQFEPKLKVPKLIHDRPVCESNAPVDDPSHALSQPLFTIAVSRRKDQVWTEKREAELQRALMKWDTIIRNWPDAWRCKRELVACSAVNESMNLLGDYLSGKAPSTLVKRANSMVFLHTTLQQLGFFWPVGEPDVYRIIKTLHSSGNSTSRLKSILEAITFCRYSFDIEDLHPITVSKRCLGATGGDVANKLNQAAPLTVADIWQLHLCLDTGDAWDRVFSGAALFCIYARARWSDFIHGNCIRLDVLDSTGQVAYADMEVQIHKTMKAAANKFKFLDLVVSGSGFFGNDWVRSWVDALNNIGVDPFSNEPGKTLMPAPAADGTALQRALESDEASVWLRLMLGEKVKRSESTRQISSHSLKATLLSMAAKRGLKHEDRLAMGHHVHPFKMADTYARDAQARTIRLIDKLLLEIRAGYFNPDSTRAGRFNKNYAPDSSMDVGAVSFFESEVESAALEAAVDETLDDAVQVVEDDQIDLEEEHFTSSSSDSDAESLEYNVDNVWSSNIARQGSSGVRAIDGSGLDSPRVVFGSVSQKWLATMFAAYCTDPPTGFGKVGLQQLVSADKAMWTILARELSTVKPDNTGKRPLDEAILKLVHDPRVTMYMLSLPNKGPATSVPTRPASTPDMTPSAVQPKKKARPSKKNRHLDSLQSAEEEFTFEWLLTKVQKERKCAAQSFGLTNSEDLQFLMDFIKQEAFNLCLFHFAPPCGACSAARKRESPLEVQAKLKDGGIAPPLQLRSE
ncbi:unnamed protein product [Cladocopium goreaui]|uniref:Tyr recombinase domain-containing protein n=1 Tax=Cladocopium goreaui TaxID=2562237 RepID=A0A9P1CTM1_9DINO|nr:unnamed protein product [Cladocopium goreaui]